MFTLVRDRAKNDAVQESMIYHGLLKPVSLLIQWYFFWTEYFTSLFVNISNCVLGDRFL